MCRRLSLLFLTSVLLVPVLLGGAVVSDPVDPQADARLAKAHTFFFPPAPLGELLQTVSQQTRVSLRAERSVAQHRVILVVHDKPLHEPLNTLAEAFGYTWRRGGKKDSPPEYMLYQPAQAMSQQRAEVQSLRQMYLRLLREAVREWSHRQITDLNAVREEVNTAVRQLYRDGQKPRSREETLRAIRTAIQAQLTQSWATWSLAYTLARFNPQQWNALERGEVFVVDTSRTDSPLPPEVLDVFRRENEAVTQRLRNPFPDERAEQFRREQMARYRAADRAIICFALHPVSGRLYYSTGVLAGNEIVSSGGKAATAPLWETATALQDLPAGGESLPPYEPNLVERLSEKTPCPVSLEPSAAMDVTGNVLALHARENGVDLVAEWYPYLPREESDAGEARVETLPVVGMGEGIRIRGPSRDLEADEVAFGSVKIVATALDWRTVQNNLRRNRYLLRDSDGWIVVSQQLRSLCRQHEIPETGIRKWFLKPGRQGTSDASDLLEIAALLPEQIERLEVKRQNLPQANRESTALTSLASSPSMQAVLLAAASASSAQRQSLLHGIAVPFPLLSPQAQRYLLYAVQWAPLRRIPGRPEESSFAVRVQETVQEEPDMARFSEDLLRSLRNETPEEWLRRQPDPVRQQFTRTRVTRSVRFVLTTPEGETELVSLTLTR